MPLYIIDSHVAVTGDTPEEAVRFYFNLTGSCYHDMLGVEARSVNEGAVTGVQGQLQPVLNHKGDKIYHLFKKDGDFFVKAVYKIDL